MRDINKELHDACVEFGVSPDFIEVVVGVFYQEGLAKELVRGKSPREFVKFVADALGR